MSPYVMCVVVTVWEITRQKKKTISCDRAPADWVVKNGDLQASGKPYRDSVSGILFQPGMSASNARFQPIKSPQIQRERIGSKNLLSSGWFRARLHAGNTIFSLVWCPLFGRVTGKENDPVQIQRVDFNMYRHVR